MALVHERVLGQERERLSLSLFPSPLLNRATVLSDDSHALLLSLKFNHLHTGPISKQKHLAC